MRRVFILGILGVLAGGCHCQGPIHSVASEIVIIQPAANDAGQWVLDFGIVDLPNSKTQQVILKNEGTLGGNLLTAKLRTGSDPSFSVTVPTLPAAILPAQELQLPVVYTPSNAGSAVGYLDMTTDDPKLLSATVMLVGGSGAGQVLVCVEQADAGWLCNGPEGGTLSINFGTLLVNQEAVRNIQVRSVGSSPVDYFGTTWSAGSSPELSLVPAQNNLADGGTPIAPNGVVEFAAQFLPTAAGVASGTATVSTSDPATPQVPIQITGQAVASLNCDLQVTPSPLNFGSVPNTMPVDQTLVVVNVGLQPCHISGLPLTGSGAFALISPPTLPDTLNTNGVLTLDVEYTPSGTTVDMGTLTIDSDDPVKPMLAVTLEATSINPPPCTLTAQPSPVQFGGLAPGGRELKTVTLTANGDDICVLWSAKLTTADNAYTVSAAVPLAVANPDAGFTTDGGFGVGNGSITITYAPTQAGNDNDTLDLVYSALSQPFTFVTLPVPLFAAAGQQQLCISPQTLHFGAVPVGSSNTLAFNMTACGNSPVTVTSITVETPPTPFALAAPIVTTPANIVVGTTTPEGVSFSPTMTGAASAKVHVVSSDPIFPDQYVNLDNAPVTDCVLQIAPPSVNFGVLPSGLQVQKQVVLSNQGSGTCNLSGIALSAGSAAAGFSLIGAPANLTIPFGSSAPPLVVQANLPAGAPSVRQGKVTFTSNDASQPNVTIPISAFLKGTGPYAQGWPKLYFDNNNNSRTISDTSSVTGRLLWTFQMPAIPTNTLNDCPTFDMSPVVGPDGTVYQLDMSGVLHAINAAGNQLWQSPQLESPAVDPFGATPFLPPDGTVYVTGGSDGAGTATLYHLSDAGVILATTTPTIAGDAGDGFDVPPLIGSDGLVYAFDDFPGIIIYSQNPLTAIEGTETANNVNERGCFALANNDTSYWNTTGQTDAYTAPTPPSGGLNQLWQFPAPFGGFTAIGATISIDTTTGYVLSASGYVGLTGAATGIVAYDPLVGTQIWTKMLPLGPTTSGEFDAICSLFTTDTGNCAPSVGVDGTIYIGNVDGMYALDGSSGAIKAGWPYHTAAVTDTASIGGDGALFFGAIDGTFYALNSNGTLRFTLKAGGRISSSPAIGPDGTVYFVADDALLYAVH